MQNLNKELLDKYKAKIKELIGIDVEFYTGWNTKQPLEWISYMKCYSEATLIRNLANNSYIAHFNLTELPGCCAYLVSNNVVIETSWQNKGLGTLLNSMRIDIAKFLGYTHLLCTDVIENEPQRKILAKNGWKDIHTCTNKRTNNKIALSIIEL